MKKLFLLILLLIPLLFNVSCNDEENKEVITYTVSFVNDDILEEVTVKENDKVSKPVDPVKDGFEFIGWYLNDELFSFESPITSNITLNAKYEEVIKTYNVLVVFDNNEIKFNDITELSLTDITKIDGYEYIGLYTDSLYQNEFDGTLKSDITLYLKYKKYHSVLVKTDKEEISLKVYHGEKIDTNIFYEKGYKNCIYYIDKNNIYVGASPLFNIDGEKVYTDIDLTLVEGLVVSFYEEGLLKERIILEPNTTLNDEIYKYKYSNYEFYLDKEYKSKFDFNTKIAEDTNIYLKPIKVDDTKVKVQINIKDSYGIVNYIQLFYIEKGKCLSFLDIYQTFNLIFNHNYLNYFLYYDEKCTSVYNYGPLYDDIVLYTYEKSEEIIDYVNVYVSYLDGNGDSTIFSIPMGTAINEDYSLLTNGEAFDGFYYDPEGKLKYNDEPIYTDSRLYIKTRKFTEEDNIHNVKIYYTNSNIYKYGIEEVISSIDFNDKNYLYLDTNIKDGEIISLNRCERPNKLYNVSMYALYDVNNKCIYNNEPLLNDSVFVLLLHSIGMVPSLNYTWDLEILEFFKLPIINYSDFLLIYNDKENNNLIYIPNRIQKKITIVDNLNNSYQIFADVNSMITKEEIIEIMKKKNININNIEISDIFVTEDVVIKVGFLYIN